MKKATLGLAVLLPLTLLLCACGESGSLDLSANWYKSGNGDNVSGKSEVLEYNVTFKPSDDTVTTLSYGNGTYVTKLSAETFPISSGSVELGYHLHSELSIPVTYSVAGQEQTFTDSVVSDVYFKTVTSRLQPVRSVKTVHSTSPLTSNPKTMDEAYEVYDYVYEINYTDGLSKATINYAQTLPEEKSEEKTMSVKSKDSFFDNEQLLFVLRGLNMSSSVSLKTINPLDFKQTGVNMSSPAALSYSDSFLLNGEEVAVSEEKPVKAYGVTLKYNGTYSGPLQKFIYAANTATDKGGENIYRNVLLEMSVPVLQGFGSLDYKLKSATFQD